MFQVFACLIFILIIVLWYRRNTKNIVSTNYLESDSQIGQFCENYSLELPFLRKSIANQNSDLPKLFLGLERGDNLIFTFYNDQSNKFHLAIKTLNKEGTVIGIVTDLKSRISTDDEFDFTFTWSYINEDGAKSSLYVQFYRFSNDINNICRLWFIEPLNSSKRYCFDTIEPAEFKEIKHPLLLF